MKCSRLILQKRRRRLLRRVTLALAVLSLLAVIAWSSFKNRARTDPRLLGTWEPAVEMTLEEMNRHDPLSDAERAFWTDSLSSVNVRYYPKYIGVTHKNTGRRIPYRVAERHDYSLVLVKSENGRQIREPVHFNEDFRMYWIPLAQGSELRKYYRRVSGSPPEPEKTWKQRMRELLGIREG
jgi:hypothetical protein